MGSVLDSGFLALVWLRRYCLLLHVYVCILGFEAFSGLFYVRGMYGNIV